MVHLKINTKYYGVIRANISVTHERDIYPLVNALQSLETSKTISCWNSTGDSYKHGKYQILFENHDIWMSMTSNKSGFHPINFERQLEGRLHFHSYIIQGVDHNYRFVFNRIIDNGSEIQVKYFDSNILIAQVTITRFLPE